MARNHCDPWLDGESEQREPESWGMPRRKTETGRGEGEEISTEKYKVWETN